MLKGGLSVLFLVGLCSLAIGQTGASSSSDTEFMKWAATSNMTEAHLGKMAQEQASSSDVKSFGQTLVQDHTKAYDELSAVAKKTGETVPTGIDIRRNHAIEQLMHDKGAAFDRRFLSHEIQDHKKAIAEFKREAEKGQNPDVKAYAQKMLPTLQEHLQKAEELEKAKHTTASASARRRRH